MNDNDRNEIEKMINQAVLTKEDIKKDIIKPLLATVNAYHEGDLKLINADLKRILEQTTKTNSRVSRSEAKIEELEKKEIAHIINCPQEKRVRNLEDNQLSQKSIKKWIVGTVGIASLLIGIFYIIFQTISV